MSINRYLLLAAGLLLATSSAFAQSSPTDSQTLAAILQQLRLIRTDLRATAALSERSHALLFRLQVQQLAVAHASDAVLAAQSKLSDVQERRKNLELGLKRLEEERDNESDPAALKTLNNNIAGMKEREQFLQSEEQQALQTEGDAQQQLQIEQSKADELENRLDQIDNQAEELTRAPTRQPR